MPVSNRVDACDHGVLVLGPVRIERAHGTPRTETFPFSVPEGGSYCLKVKNGSGEGNRVTAGWIALDYADVTGPDRFLKHLPEFLSRGTMTAGEHVMEVRVASAPGSFITVEVRFAGDKSEEEVGQSTSLGELEYEACKYQNSQMELLSPENAQRMRELAGKSGMPLGQMYIRFNAYGVPRQLGPLPAEEDAGGDDLSAEERALEWLDLHRSLLRWTDSRISLRVVQVQDAAVWGTRVRLDEFVGGLRIDGARLEVRLDPLGIPLWLSGNFVPHPPDSLDPVVPEDDAVAAAADSVSPDAGPSALHSPRLVVLDLSTKTGEAAAVLAWRVAVVAPGVAGERWTWVDAVAGSVVYSADSIFEDDGDDHAAELKLWGSNDADPAPWSAPKVYPDPTDPPHACIGEESDWCPDVLLWLTVLDAEWFAHFGREGWSGNEGVPPREDLPEDPGIPANDMYRILHDNYVDLEQSEASRWWIFHPPSSYWTTNYLLESRNPDGDVFQGYSDPLEGVLPGRSVVLIPPHLTPDVVRHEFSHGFYQAETGVLIPADVISPISYFPISEHVADFWALGAGEHDFGMEYWSLPLPPDVGNDWQLAWSQRSIAFHRNHGGTGCTTDWSECPEGCREFTHLAYFNEFWMQPLFCLPSGDCYGRGDPHRIGCILTKMSYLLMQEDFEEISWHGISTRPIPWNLARWLYYQHLTQDLTPDADFHDYGNQFRTAVWAMANKCDPEAPGEPGELCAGDRDEANKAFDAVDSMGFWSPAHDVTIRAASIEETVVPTSAPAAIFFEGRLWVYFVGMPVALYPDMGRRDLYAISMADPFSDTEIAESINVTSELPDGIESNHAPAAAVHDGQAWIAYVPLLRGTVDTLSGPPDAPRPVAGQPFGVLGETNGGPALASANGSLFVVAADADSGILRFAVHNPPSDTVVGEVGQASSCNPGEVPPSSFDAIAAGAAPFLTVAQSPVIDRLFLSYISSPRYVDGDGYCIDDALEMLQFDWYSSTWSEAQLPQALLHELGPDNPASWGAVQIPKTGGTLLSPGPAVSFFKDRIQVAYPGYEGSYWTGLPRAIRQASFEPGMWGIPPDPPTLDYSGARPVPLAAESDYRPALVVWDDTVAGEKLLMFWVSMDPLGPRLKVAWRRSDS